MGCSCPTFREEPLAGPCVFTAGALIYDPEEYDEGSGDPARSAPQPPPTRRRVLVLANVLIEQPRIRCSRKEMLFFLSHCGSLGRLATTLQREYFFVTVTRRIRSANAKLACCPQRQRSPVGCTQN